MLFIFVMVCKAGAMGDNNTENNAGRVGLGRVLQTTLVRHERVAVRTARSWVNDNSFDGLKPSSLQRLDSASCICLSQASTSRGHESLDDAADLEVPEAPEGREESSGPLESCPGGLYDTSLLHFNADHGARHI